MRYVCALIIILLANILNGSEQSNPIDCKKQIVIPNGFFIKYFPYIIEFGSSETIYVTFNDRALQSYVKNSFTLIATENGILSIYNIKGLDTLLIKQQYLRFLDPKYTVVFMGKQSGGTIEREKLSEYPILIEIIGNDASENISIASAHVKYYKQDKLVTVNLQDNFIPIEAAQDIKRLACTTIIFIIEIQVGKSRVQLPPSVFFLSP